MHSLFSMEMRTWIDGCSKCLYEMMTYELVPIHMSKQAKMVKLSQDMGWHQYAWVIFFGTKMMIEI